MTAPLPASSVVLARGPGHADALLVTRAPALRFMGGFTAFPGGKVHDDDARLAVEGLTAFQVAAVRELFEETGVLLARRRQDGASLPPDARWPDLRKRLLAEEAPFGDVLGLLDAQLDARDLRPAGALVTPAFAPLRFDTRFFVADLPPGQEVDIWEGELVASAWRSATDALRDWEQGGWLLSPPTVSILEVLRGRPIEHLPERLRPLLDRLETGALPAIFFSPGVRMIPLDCRGLPPTTHTNAWLVGTGPTYLIDPGPADPAEQDRLFAALEGSRLDAIVLTHHHPDHVGAARVCAERYGVPVYAHRKTAARLAGKVTVDRFLDEGDTLDLGEAPHGRGRWALRALHTPGHAPDHLAFYEEDYRLLFAGDMVSTLSSIIVAPPDGDLTTYLASLHRLAELPARLLLPAHGPVSARPAFVVAEALAHRAKREEQLLAALAAGRETIEEIVGELYRGLPESSRPLAELQVRAGLDKLRREGRLS